MRECRNKIILVLLLSGIGLGSFSGLGNFYSLGHPVSFELVNRRIRDTIVIKKPEDVFRITPATRQIILGLPKELKGVDKVLTEQLKKEGFGVPLDDLGEDKTILALSDKMYNDITPEIWNDILKKGRLGVWYRIPQQIQWHGRDAQIEYVRRNAKTDKLEIIVRVVKGSGKINPDDVDQDGYKVPQIPGVVRPFFINPPKELHKVNYIPSNRTTVEVLYSKNNYAFTVHTLVGGVLLTHAIREQKVSLAIHKLLMEIDGGERANVPIYEKINQIENVPVLINGEERLIPAEQYFTDPELLGRPELLTVAYELRRKVKEAGGAKNATGAVEKYLDILWNDNYQVEIKKNSNKATLELVKVLVKEYIEIATLTKWERSNLRVDEFVGRQDSTSNYDYIGMLYGENLIPENMIDKQALSRLMREFTYSLARTLGAIHGAGGHFQGVGDFTSSVHGRDISVTGEMQDLMDSAHIPFFGIDEITNDADIKPKQLKDQESVKHVIGVLSSYLYVRTENDSSAL